MRAVEWLIGDRPDVALAPGGTRSDLVQAAAQIAVRAGRALAGRKANLPNVARPAWIERRLYDRRVIEIVPSPLGEKEQVFVL